ncbi:uncharacterized protein LOC126904005, partial [Daktulosphaira vitifoliae]|uniref:uncharacterized protein LOC126904005 n=1 Tax=Daktulosphaira vitifoliae TaxID=58002 RepID=UPI0021AA1B17
MINIMRRCGPSSLKMCCSCFLRYASSQSFNIDKVKPPPIPDIVRKPARLPFLKTIYAKQYDLEVLTYPEVLNLERYKDMESRMQQVHNNCSKIDTIGQLGLFGMNVPYPSSGLNLSETEITRLFEYFDSNIYKDIFNHTVCVDIVKTFGTPNQKSVYLPLFASATCSYHDNVNSIKKSNEIWELNGSVERNQSVYMLIFDGSNAFIVEKDITLVDGDYIHLKQFNVVAENVIENVNMKDITNKGKLYTCSSLNKSLKNALRKTINNILTKERHGDKLRHYDSVLKIVANSLVNIYSIESMIYLTTWMIDGYDNPDVELETATIEMFSRQTANTILRDLKTVYGRNSIKEPFLTCCNDIEKLVLHLKNSIELSEFISSRGIEYSNKSDYKENVSFLVSAYRNMMMKKDDPSLTYGFQQFLHPALKHSANALEYCVLK